ncbi:hypothetical protein V8F20_001471 [Naviculisporaceae sp. PSN 640]
MHGRLSLFWPAKKRGVIQRSGWSFLLDILFPFDFLFNSSSPFLATHLPAIVGPMSTNVPVKTPVAEDDKTKQVAERSKPQHHDVVSNSSTKRGEERIDQLEAVLAEQTAAVSDLVKEIQESNCWLKRLLSERFADDGEVIPGAKDVGASPIVEPERRELHSEHGAAESGISSDRMSNPSDEMYEVFKAYLTWSANDELIADAWRRVFLERLEETYSGIGAPGECGLVVAKAAEFKSLFGADTLQIVWGTCDTNFGRFRTPMLREAKKRARAMEVFLDKWWPRGPAATYALNNFRYDFSGSSLWIEKTPWEGILELACSLFQHAAGEQLVPAQTPRDGNLEITKACVGAIWFLPAYHGHISLDIICRMAPRVFSRNRPYPPEHPVGDGYPFLEFLAQALKEFACGWDRGPARFGGSMLDVRRGPFEGMACISHNIRVFRKRTLSDFYQTLDVRTTLKCARESGRLSVLRGEDIDFVEERHSLLLVSDGCLFDNHHHSRGTKILPHFTILLIGELRDSKGYDAPPDVMEWEERGFTARGERSGFMLFQSALHALLVWWEKEWSACLDMVDGCVRVKLFDVLGGPNSGNTENFMFDNSFQKSRVYFQALQALRIFSESIQETGRHLHLLSAHLESSPRQWLGDENIQNNWKIVTSFQAEAEERLLRRIGEKTEEIKSLRDGLFNATSLLEASRSTTMNRYVIIFTIVTVIYLPPSFVATVFGTDLFNSEDTDDTINKFKFITVGISLITYLVALLLVWLVDRTNTIRVVYLYPLKYSHRFFKWLVSLGGSGAENEPASDEESCDNSRSCTRSPGSGRSARRPYRSSTSLSGSPAGSQRSSAGAPTSRAGYLGGSTSAAKRPWRKLTAKLRRPENNEEPEV